MGTMVRLIDNYCFDKRLKILTFLDVDNVYTIHNSAIKHEHARYIFTLTQNFSQIVFPQCRCLITIIMQVPLGRQSKL